VQADLHQHLLGEPLLEALALRTSPPLTRPRRDGWVLEVPGEAPHPVDQAAEDPVTRAALLESDGLDRAAVALSGVLGVEGLPGDEAERLLAAHHEGLAALPERFGRWASVSLLEPSTEDVEAQLADGAVGLTLPAGALSTPERVERLALLLEPLAKRRRPLFVHPGPCPWEDPPAAATGGDWWPALTRYVAEMNTAWHAFVSVGPEPLPPARIVFALLAGLAPLHLERLAVRGGPAERALDSRFLYDVSSYGPRSIEAVGRVVGAGQLVFGSDRPVDSPAPPAASPWTRLAARNAAALLG
jgi:6-methylsalicylate decarboxylase